MTAESPLEELRVFRPEWALVLGSGLSGIVRELEVRGRLAYAQVPGLPVSTVAGHPGELVWGVIGGTRVVAACGRVHLYQGYTAVEVVAGVVFLAGLGVRRIVLTNAAGSINEAHPPGAWMALRDHLNLTGTSPLLGGPNFIPMDGIYSARLRARFAAAAVEEGVPLYDGVYAGVVGPQYETPAEVRMLRVLGADAVGMSTVLEALQAHALGCEVAAFSCLTNWAAGLSAQPLEHAAVVAAGAECAEAFWCILRRALRPCED